MKLSTCLSVLASAAALCIGSAQAQTIVNVAGVGVVGDEILPTNTVPRLANWTAQGGAGFTSTTLVSPTVTVTADGPVTLKFDHRYFIEAAWDGAAIFVSKNGAPATYLDGTAFSANGYVGNTLANPGAWPGGENVFYGKSTDYDTSVLIESVADLGTFTTGDTISVQFVMKWDAGYDEPGTDWEIGRVQILDSAPSALLDATFQLNGASGFTVSNGGTPSGPFSYLTKIVRFELDATTPDADRYQPANPGDAINLNNAVIQVAKFTGTYAPATVFSLFDLSGGTTLTGAIGSLSLPGGVWDTSNLTTNGTITLVTPPNPACQLGVLSLAANGGINPNTGVAWAVGDKYRIAFYTAGTTATTSNDPKFYNDFATTEAWAGTVTGLQGTHWKAMVTVNTVNYLTEAAAPKSDAKGNTGTGDLTGGAGVGGAGGPVYVVDGTTCIARNNADIWDGWSNPFAANATVRTGTVYYSPYLTQSNAQLITPNANHGQDVATGCSRTGGLVNALGNATDNTTISRGNSNANNTDRVWNRFTDATTAARAVYAISVPLTIVDLTETTAPALVSVTDDQGATEAKLGVDSIAYTVTFSEPMDAATITTADFSVTGTATATVNIVRGTLDPAVFEVTVTPTSVGTFQFQVNSGAVVEDPVGNVFTFPSDVIDDNTITVIDDVTAPTLASSDIVDNVSGGPVTDPATVVYTVTFSEAIDYTSVSTADFENGGTVNTTITNVTPSAPNQFKVTAVTSDVLGASTLILQVKAGAIIKDLAGNDLVTGSPIADDTTISVDNIPKVVSITDGVLGGPVFSDQSFYYTVVFSEAMSAATVEIADFQASGSSGATVTSITPSGKPTTFYVGVTPGVAGTITLQVASGAGLTDLIGNSVATGSAIPDDVTITVNAGPSPLRLAVTLDGTAGISVGSSPVSVTFNASASDKLVVVVTGENGNPGSLVGDCTGVTYDGVALTQAVNRNPAALPLPFDQNYNDIWYLDNPGAVHTAGVIAASVNSRGNVTAFALSNTAPGVGATAISSPQSKSVEIIPIYANSMVIASHGMGGDGNTANVTVVNTVAPLVETSARFNGSSWDGHVTGYAPVASAIPTTYAFTLGNTVGTHTIAAEFPPAVNTSDYLAWAGSFAPANLTDPDADLDMDGLTNDEERLFGLDPTSAGSVDPYSAPLSAGTFSFTRRDNALTGKFTDIETSTDLQMWTVDSGAALVDNGPGGNGVEIVDVTLSPGLLSAPALFVRVVQRDALTLLSENFEAGNGGFTLKAVGALGSVWQHGDPDSTGFGGSVTQGNGGSTNCWGTNIGNPGYYINPTTTCLRSVEVDLTNVGAATLTFAEALDLGAGDTAVVNIVELATDTIISSAIYTATDGNTATSLWAVANGGTPIAIPPAAIGEKVRIEWCLSGVNDDYFGWYIDDVTVQEIAAP